MPDGIAMNKSRYFSLFLIPLVVPLILAGGSVAANPIQIDNQTVNDIDTCVKTEYDKFITTSRSLCVGVSRYYDSGGNNHSHSVSVQYTLNVPDWAGYNFRAGSESAHIQGGQCKFTISAIVNGPKDFTCYYWTEGCGLFKAGGHVRGYCNVGIEYIPRPGDIVNFKRYCISKFAGGPVLPEPRSYPVGCQLN